ncbi:ZMYM6 protein, partial [Amia calva]|nr:ZMYM6 protein [Amia calva]
RKRGRKYDESFPEYGFTSILVKNEEKPQCLICHKVLSSKSIKPNKLKRHLETYGKTSIPLSNNTRIEAIAANHENTLVKRLKNTDAYALQVDMSTEGHDAHFWCFVRYIWDGAILEDILFCLPLPGHETAQEILHVLHGYLKDNYIPFDRMVGFRTDGAPAVAGNRAGMRALKKRFNGHTALVTRNAPAAAWTHCMIHREQLAAKDLSTEGRFILLRRSASDVTPPQSQQRVSASLRQAALLSQFWFRVKNEYPALSTRAMTLLVPFATMYLCEAGFSALVCIKSQYRSTLDVPSDIRCATSTTPPDFDKLSDNIQAHASH